MKLSEEEADESLAWRVLDGVAAELADLGLDIRAIEEEVSKIGISKASLQRRITNG